MTDIDDGEGWMDRHAVSIISLPGVEGIEIYDPIERYRYHLGTPDDVTLESADTGDFPFPVDAAVRAEASGFTLPTVELVHIRTPDGSALAEVHHDDTQWMPPGEYLLELCTPIKTYVRAETQGLSVESGRESMEIDFFGPTTVTIGARSVHVHPAGKIQTPARPEAITEAISAFSSALKTESPERAFPSFRGHPPAVELADELSIPDDLSPPSTGVEIVVRPQLADAFTVASLAYYLGATVIPGDERVLRTEGGFERSLDPPGLSFSDAVGRALKQVFTLDCVTRTEGIHPIDLHARTVLESRVTLDYAALYEAPLSERVAAYLRLEYETLADLVPDWGLAAHIEPTPSAVEYLPYLVDDLAIIRTHTESPATAASPPVEPPDGAFVRSAGNREAVSQGFVEPPATGAVTETWIGDGAPLGAAKAVKGAFEHRLDREPTDGPIDITVVCNDADMGEEPALIREVYGSRGDLPFTLHVERNLSSAELAEAFLEGTDFLHYIGHVDGTGFECRDGKLDASSLDAVGVDAFLLNACQSYEQGRRLIEAGSVGGIVTLNDVVNKEAVGIGETLARLLNAGFPLYAALEIAREQSYIGGSYGIVGDSRVQLAQSQSVPNMSELELTEAGVDFTYVSFPTRKRDLGTVVMPYLECNDSYYLVSRRIENLSPERDDLRSFLSVEDIPVRRDGSLEWSRDLVDTVLGAADTA